MQNCYFPTAAVAAADADANGNAAGKRRNGNAMEKKALVDAALPRADGIRRSADQLRPAFMKLGVVSGASGSAYVEMHRTRVVCSVYGPRNDTRSRRQFSQDGQLVCDFKYAPFADASGRRERGQDADELEMSAVLAQALSPAVMLSKLPKCVVSIYVVVLEGDGSELAAAINCASLALVDAAIEMLDVVTAASAGIQGEGVVLDPCREEELRGDGHVVLAYMPTVGQITHMLQSGRMQHSQLQDAVDLCTDACTGIVRTMVTTAITQALQ